MNIPLGIGYYTAPEASKLLQMPTQKINRWLKGYKTSQSLTNRAMPPLWQPQLPIMNQKLHLGFRDLIELRFVDAFVNAGVDMRVVRACLQYARELVNDERPFSTQRFRTDGRSIFLETIQQFEHSHEASRRELIDLKNKQYAFRDVLERGFKDLDIEDDAVARWRPLRGKSSIVIDPHRAFGQPIASKLGVPTIVLRDAVEAEGSIRRASELYEVAENVVRDACEYEQRLNS